MQIRQISIFLQNKPGQLSQICRDLADADINLATLSLADTSDFGIVRRSSTTTKRPRRRSPRRAMSSTCAKSSPSASRTVRAAWPR